MAKDQKTPNQDPTRFRLDRVKKLKALYSDEASSKRRYDQTPHYSAVDFKSAAEVRNALSKAVENRASIVQTSQKLYCINPIYASVINYLANIFLWRYKVIPHKLFTNSKAKLKKTPKEEDFQIMYNKMLEIADGLSFDTKFPALLTLLYVNGGVYFTTISDEETLSVDTIILPDNYCKKIGETQFGTAIISFDYSYFDSLSYTKEEFEEYLGSFPEEFRKGYKKYKKDVYKNRYAVLDPRFSSGILLNDMSIPTYFYLLGGILDYEQYQDNELERNENLLKYLVVHTIPHYEDRLIFEVDEVDAMHKSLRKVVEVGDKTKLITTYGDIHKEQLGENESTASEVLEKSFNAIFNNAGFNDGIFTGESVKALEMSLIRDKGIVWRYVKALLNFYNIAINNWFNFDSYQADIDILPISPYTYSDDMEIYKTNATLGVGKLDYFIASGIKQKHVQDQLSLESFLKLDQIVPMQTSYTQTAEDRSGETKGSEDSKTDNSNTTENKDGKSGIEPTEKKSESSEEKTESDKK